MALEMRKEKNKRRGSDNLEEVRRMDFAKACSLKSALKIAWGYHGGTKHGFYQHYTTLSSVMTKICLGQWWLTRSTAVSLNDRQEAKKFGDWELAERTYQASFVRGVDESAAMWGLYGRNNPFAIKILIPEAAMQDWIKELKKKFKGDVGRRKNVAPVAFKDVIYASVPFVQKNRDRFDKDRGNSICWDNVRCNFGHNKAKQKSLARDLLDPKMTGWVKDSEWRHECETRLCVRVPRLRAQDAIPVQIPPEVIDKMSFTFSPWLDRSREVEVRRLIECALKINAGRLKRLKLADPRQSLRFHRSVLQGALHFREDDVGVKSDFGGCQKCMRKRNRTKMKGKRR